MPKTFSDAAAEARNYFEKGTRDSGVEFWRTENAPEWVSPDLVRRAHDDGNMLPDDVRYAMLVEVLDAISDAGEDFDPDELHELIDPLVDVYNSELTAWLASSVYRLAYCDQAIEDLGDPGDMCKRIQYGQYAEYEEIFHAVIACLREQLDDE